MGHPSDRLVAFGCAYGSLNGRGVVLFDAGSIASSSQILIPRCFEGWLREVFGVGRRSL